MKAKRPPHHVRALSVRTPIRMACSHFSSLWKQHWERANPMPARLFPLFPLFPALLRMIDKRSTSNSRRVLTSDIGKLVRGNDNKAVVYARACGDVFSGGLCGLICKGFDRSDGLISIEVLDASKVSQRVGADDELGLAVRRLGIEHDAAAAPAAFPSSTGDIGRHTYFQLLWWRSVSAEEAGTVEHLPFRRRREAGVGEHFRAGNKEASLPGRKMPRAMPDTRGEAGTSTPALGQPTRHVAPASCSPAQRTSRAGRQTPTHAFRSLPVLLRVAHAGHPRADVASRPHPPIGTPSDKGRGGNSSPSLPLAAGILDWLNFEPQVKRLCKTRMPSPSVTRDSP